MNEIINEITESRNGMYIHAIEVSDIYELENIAESIYCEFIDRYNKDLIIDFLESLQVYCLDESNENSVLNFSFTEYLNESI